MNEISTSIDNKKSFVLYFFNDTCSPCVALRPKIAELIDKQFPAMELRMINAAENPGLTADFGVFASPTILVFFEGKEYIRESKYISIKELESKIQRFYDLINR